MRHKLKNLTWLLLITVFAVTSCQKNDANLSATNSGAESAAIAVAALSGTTLSTAKSTAGTPTDSVYVVYNCGKGSHRDTIAAAALPAAVTSYLATNYAGYSFQTAYVVKDRNSVTTGYIVVITFNATPVAVAFNAAGTFVKVLEQREGRDMDGKGWHNGGRFDLRDGRHGDTVALSALPAAVTGYYASNYPTDTLVAAFRNRDSSLLVLSKNNGAFATVFSATGTFISRVQLQSRQAKVTSIEASALPAKVTSYLATTYPGYVFQKAFAIKPAGGLQGYVVVIDANTTKYAIQFDAAGNFVRSVTIR